MTNRTRPIAMLVALIAITGGPAGIAKIAPESVVGMWLFDEGAGDVVADSSANGHHGTGNGADSWTEGVFEQALEIGGGTFVRVTANADDPDALSLTTYTVTAWMQTESAGDWIAVIAKADRNENRNYTLYIHLDNNTAAISIGDEGANTWHDASGQTIVNDGDWHHVAISFDDDSDTGRVFTDGLQEAEYKVLNDVPQNTADLVFAAWNHAGGNGAYIGLLDEIGLFNVALEEADIKAIMTDGLPEAGLSVDAHGKLATRWAALRRDAY